MIAPWYNSTMTYPLIIGLGNPGERYAATRHNAGALFVAHICGDTILGTQQRIHARTARITFHNQPLRCAVPTTYMNESGRAVAALMAYYNLTLDDIIIVHDDSDFFIGDVAHCRNRGAAGHNGVADIIRALGTKDFTRIRIGVRPRPRDPGAARAKAATFVLAPFTVQERAILSNAFIHATDILATIVRGKQNKSPM